MPELVTGKLAPDFTLSTTEGKTVKLHELLKHGPVVLAFFKVSCPTCQLALPLYERMAKAQKGRGATVLGISQNKPSDTEAFAREYGVTFPIAIDDEANRYAVSNAYGLTNVPTLFYIAPSCEIKVSSVGWSKAELDEVNAKLAASRHEQPPALWRKGEDVPAFRAG